LNKEKDIIAAIDIGTTKTVTIAGRFDNNGFPEILGLSRTDTKGFDKGIVIDKEEFINAIRLTVEEVQKQTGIEIREAYVGVAGLKIGYSLCTTFIMRSLTDDEISERDIERLLGKAYNTSIPLGEEIYKIVPQSFTIDGEKNIRSPVGCNGLRFELVYRMFTDKTSTISLIRRLIEQSLIKVKETVLASVASAYIVLTPEEIYEGVLLVDFGTDATDIVLIYYGDLKYVAALSKLTTLSESNDIIDALFRHFEISLFRDYVNREIVLTGGGAYQSNFREIIKSKTGFDVRIGDPDIKVAPESSFRVNCQEYSTSVGLLQYGFSKFRSEISSEGEYNKYFRDI
jgi:cell division protein FtsA